MPGAPGRSQPWSAADAEIGLLARVSISGRVSPGSDASSPSALGLIGRRPGDPYSDPVRPRPHPRVDVRGIPPRWPPRSTCGSPMPWKAPRLGGESVAEQARPPPVDGRSPGRRRPDGGRTDPRRSPGRGEDRAGRGRASAQIGRGARAPIVPARARARGALAAHHRRRHALACTRRTSVTCWSGRSKWPGASIASGMPPGFLFSTLDRARPGPRAGDQRPPRSSATHAGHDVRRPRSSASTGRPPGGSTSGTGQVGESFRTLSAMHSDGRSEERAADPDPVRDGLQLLTAGTFAEISAYHGDAAQARVLHDRLETAAGDDPYAVTVATTMAARTAAVVGDPEWALGRSGRGIAVDPHFSFVFLGTYLRLARCWAMAMSGRDPGPASDEAERLILVNLSNPVRSCVSTWYALLAEMRIAAGSLSAASAALDRADDCLERYGQRSAEGARGPGEGAACCGRRRPSRRRPPGRACPGGRARPGRAPVRESGRAAADRAPGLAGSPSGLNGASLSRGIA